MVLAGSASAQMNLTAALAGSPQRALHVNDAMPNAMSFQKVVSLSRASAREALATSLPQVASQLVTDHANGSTELLRTWQVLDMTATVNADHGVTEQHSVNVHVSYDARPVGGILSIRVELVPIFGGIGAAVRPTATREFAQAVDDFDDDFIGQTITKLTNELAAEFAAK
jgi:hypothetical protein